MSIILSYKSYCKDLMFLVHLLSVLLIAAPLSVQATPQLQSHPKALDTTKALTQFTIDHWGMEEGLPSNSIMNHLKAKSGYIWLATYDGLARFDGIKFKTYNQYTNPEFPTNSLFNIIEDRKGNLWIATNGGGVLKMVDETFTLIPKNEYLLNRTITSLAEDKLGQIWVGTRGGLSLIRDNAYVSFPEMKRLRNLHIFTVFIDSKGSLWIGTVGDGLWEIKGGLVRHYSKAQGLSNNSVRSLYEDRKGRLWIGTEEGIEIMENGHIEKVPVFKNTLSAFVNNIIEDAYGTFWFATNDGLIRYCRGAFELMKTDNEGSAIGVQNLYSDGEGSLWIGTYHKGLLRLRDGNFDNFSRAEGLPNEIINVVLPEDQGVWVGTSGGLAYIQEGVERVYMLDDNASANEVRDIFRDSRGTLWVGTHDGLFLQKGQKFIRTLQKGSGLSSDKIRRIVEDSTGKMWIGTRNGLFVRHPDRPNQVTVVDELAGIFILSLFIDSKGSLWVGTNGKGLYHLKDGHFEHFNTQNGLSSDVLFDLWEDKEGHIWAGSNNGLNVYRNKSWSSINEQKGLFVNTIFQILPGSMDNLWFTTSRGVFLVNRPDLLNLLDQKTKQMRVVKHFTRSDGMRSSEITAVSLSRADKWGTLWFTTLNGVSAINPAVLSINATPPSVRLEKVTGDKIKHSSIRDISFAAGTKQYEIQYTGFNYYAPQATTFSYILEGFDTEWQDVGSRRVAYYTNLPSGNYIFKVRAANEDGVWSENEAALVMVQEAFFWDTIWFNGLIVVVVIALILMFYYLRMNQLQHKNLKLERLIDDRTNHIISQKEAIELQREELSRLNHLKDRLLSVMSHDLRQPFSSISGLLSLLREKQIDQPEFHRFSRELSQQVKWQVHMLDNVLLWTRNQLQGLEIKPVLVNLHQLTYETCMLYRSQTTFKNIELYSAVLPDAQVVADADIIHLVLRNLVGNAVKFTSEGGAITIAATIDKDSFRLEVADNGVGMDEKKLQMLFVGQQNYSERGTSNEKGAGLGLILCKEFVEACGGKLWAESKAGFGSRFIFELPQLNAGANKTIEEQVHKTLAIS